METRSQKSRPRESIVYLSAAIKLANTSLSSYRNIYNAPQPSLHDVPTQRLKLLETSLNEMEGWKKELALEMRLDVNHVSDHVWLQRQRVCLNLRRPLPEIVLMVEYDTIRLVLYRPFLLLGSQITREMGSSCANIATSITRTIHNYLTTSSILDGCYEIFYYQWNATLVLIAYSLTSPSSISDLSIAVENFRLLSPGCTAAGRASEITSEWINNIQRGVESNPVNLDAASLDWAFPDGLEQEFASFFESDMLRLDTGDVNMDWDGQGNEWSEIFGFYDGLGP